MSSVPIWGHPSDAGCQDGGEGAPGSEVGVTTSPVLTHFGAARSSALGAGSVFSKSAIWSPTPERSPGVSRVGPGLGVC